jgi:tetratricopeptide (TPR) repeat protein
MQPAEQLIPNSADLRGQVVVLTAPRGAPRDACLADWLAGAGAQGAAAWMLGCDTARSGLWAGLNTWLRAILPDLERGAPDLVQRHDSELVAVLPDVSGRIVRRHVPLTESVPATEAVRNYALDRAHRLGHGIIDLLDGWSARTGRGPWVVVCDDFDRRGALVGRFFGELMRRRGDALGITLVAAVEPAGTRAAAEAFAPGTPVRHVALQVPSPPAPAPDPAQAELEALALEERVKAAEGDSRLQLQRLIRLWTEAGRPDKALWWTTIAVPSLTHLGYYEDALPLAERLEDALEAFRPGHHPFSRWSVMNCVYNTYVALGLAQRSHDLVFRELEHPAEPQNRAMSLYSLAMLHARHLPERDLELAETYVTEGLEVLETAQMPAPEKHFTRVFLLNGLALIRHRQGDAAQAISISRSGFEDLNAELPPERHRLHRSVLLYNAAQVYAATGATDEAIATLSAAMEMDPGYSEYYNERGNLYLRLARYPDALADYRAAVERSSPYPEVWVNMGQCLSAMGLPEEAVRAYAVAIDLDPGRHLALVRRGQVLGALGRGEEAMADYDAAVALDPAHPLVFANRAVLRFGAGRVQESLEDLDAAIGLAPENPALYRNRSFALVKLGRPEAAAADLETYLRLVPDAPDRADVERQLASLQAEPQPA